MSAKSIRKNQPRPPTPPTILIVTLNADGSGSLVTKRGDLAAMRQFTYREMKDIIAAIQQGAAQLVAVENDPPPNDLSSTESSLPSTNVVLSPDNKTDNPPEVEKTPNPDEGGTPLENSPLPSVRPARADSSSAQMSLL